MCGLMKTALNWKGWDSSMASLTQWIWVWVNSGSWWGTGKPGVLQPMGSQKVGHDWVTELNWSKLSCQPWGWRTVTAIVRSGRWGWVFSPLDLLEPIDLDTGPYNHLPTTLLHPPLPAYWAQVRSASTIPTHTLMQDLRDANFTISRTLDIFIVV